MADALWDARTREARAFFAAEVLGPLVLATRPHDIRTPEAVAEQVTAWVLCLKDVPADVLRAGVERVLAGGPTWMPKPGDLRRACSECVAERRRLVAPRAAALIAECEQCGGSGWETVTEATGAESVKRCNCHARSLAMLQGLPAPIALPPSSEESAAS